MSVEKEVVGTFLIFISVAVSTLIVRVAFILVRIHSVLAPARAESAHLKNKKIIFITGGAFSEFYTVKKRSRDIQS